MLAGWEGGEMSIVCGVLGAVGQDGIAVNDMNRFGFMTVLCNITSESDY